MEGVGYWFFLGALYLLSALLKKRQQKAAKRKLDTEDGEKNDWRPPDFLQNVFSELKEQTKDIIPEEDKNSEWSEEFPEEVQEKVEVQEEKKVIKPIEPVSSSINVESGERLKTTLHDRKHFASDYELKRSENQFHKLLQNLDDVRQGVILKEILGNPRALNRSIR